MSPEATPTPAPASEAPVSTANLAAEMKLISESVAQIEGNVASSAEPKTEPVKEAKSAPEKPAKKEAKEEKPAEETVTEETPKETPRVASAWDSIKRAEKRVREEKASAQRMLDEAKKLSTGNKTLVEALKADPLGTLAAHGIEFKSLVERVVKGDVPKKEEPKPENAVLKELAEIKAKLEDRDKQDAVNVYRDKAVAPVLQKAEFALLASRADAVDQILDFTAQYHAQHGEILPPEKVASILQDTWTEELRSLSSNQAVRAILGLAPVTTETSKEEHAKEAKKKPTGKTVTKTLNNELDGTTGTFKEDDSSVLDENEELSRALKLIPPDVWKGVA